MKVIFKRDLAKVGRKYDIKNVSDGYALNFLIPNGYVELATPEAEKRLEQVKVSENVHKQIQSDLLNKSLKSLSDSAIVISLKSNEKGHLFSSIHAEDISKHIKSQLNLDLPSILIRLEEPIKEIGTYKIRVGNEETQTVILNVEIKPEA